MKRETVLAAFDKSARILLAGVFVYSSWSKIQDPAAFALAVDSYRMLPGFAVGLVANLLPGAELVAGLALLCTKWTREAALVIFAMMAVFLAGLTQAAVRGLDISCGCFGAGGPSGRAGLVLDIFRDLALLVPVVWLMIRPGAWLGMKTSAAVAVAAALAAVALGTLPRAGGDASAYVREEPFEMPADMQFHDVPPAKWTEDFPSAWAKARETGRPLVVMLGEKLCPYCRRMRTAGHDRPFGEWASRAGVYLAHGYYSESNDVRQVLMRRFAGRPPKERDTGFPYIAVYWPKADPEAPLAVFSGRPGDMPAKTVSKSSLTVELLDSMDILLADYLATVKDMPSNADILEQTVKQVKVAAAGKGSVRMEPADGLLKDDGATVLLTATPAKGMKLAGWRLPNGKFVASSPVNPRKSYAVKYAEANGTFKAVFKKK